MSFARGGYLPCLAWPFALPGVSAVSLDTGTVAATSVVGAAGGGAASAAGAPAAGAVAGASEFFSCFGFGSSTGCGGVSPLAFAFAAGVSAFFAWPGGAGLSASFAFGRPA